MKISEKIVLIMIVLSCCVGCDQVTKEVAKQTLQGTNVISWCHDTFRLQYTENPGAFLSVGANLSDSSRFWIFVVLPGIFLCGILIFSVMFPWMHQKELFALSLFVGGGFGNLIDRIGQNGKVIDFLNIGIGSLRTGIFNVADVLIMIGAGGLILLHLQKERKGISDST